MPQRRLPWVTAIVVVALPASAQEERYTEPACGSVGNGLSFSPMRLIISTLAICLLLASGAVRSEILEGKVVGVADGDTITVLDSDKIQHKIRLSGIDAPERGQPYGNVSKQHLADLVFGKTVTVETTKKDRYGRSVGKVSVQPTDCPTCGRTLDANLAQITVGLAWWYRQYAKEQSPEDRGRYEFAEKEARAKRAGLWKDAKPVPPWEWRHGPTVTAAPLPDRTCGAKQFCREMTSCDEVLFYQRRCHVACMDENGGGTPCETLCS